MTDIIPSKRFFKIGEVSRIVGVPTHVLRYWEREFSLVRPRRAPSKQRVYRRKDVETLLHIKNLLHDEKYTIAGARKKNKTPLRSLFASPNLGRNQTRTARPSPHARLTVRLRGWTRHDSCRHATLLQKSICIFIAILL